jgi:hypothetical protein
MVGQAHAAAVRCESLVGLLLERAEDVSGAHCYNDREESRREKGFIAILLSVREYEL